MNQPNIVPASVLMNSIQYTASEPPESIIWVWNVVICASGSSTLVKMTFGPTDVAGIRVSMIT